MSAKNGYICLLSLGQLIQVENPIIFLVCCGIKLFCKDVNGKMSFFKSNSPHLKIHFMVIPLPTAMEFQQRNNWQSWHELEGVGETQNPEESSLLYPFQMKTSVLWSYTRTQFTATSLRLYQFRIWDKTPCPLSQAQKNRSAVIWGHSVCPTSFGGTAAKGWMTAARGMRACLAMSELTGKQ